MFIGSVYYSVVDDELSVTEELLAYELFSLEAELSAEKVSLFSVPLSLSLGVVFSPEVAVLSDDVPLTVLELSSVTVTFSSELDGFSELELSLLSDCSAVEASLLLDGLAEL